ERYWMDRSLAREDAVWPDGLAALTPPATMLSVSDYLADGRAIADIRDYADTLRTQADPSPSDLAGDDARRAEGLAILQALFEQHGLDALVTPTDTLTALPLDDLQAHHNGNLGLASSLGLPA